MNVDAFMTVKIETEMVDFNTFSVYRIKGTDKEGKIITVQFYVNSDTQLDVVPTTKRKAYKEPDK